MEKSDRNRIWILPLLLAIVLGGVVAVRNWQPPANGGKPSIKEHADTANGEQIELAIDTGDAIPRVIRVPWRAGMTVQDALDLASADELTFAVQGRGTEAFLTELAGFAKGAGGKNWQFEVNGKWADRSFAVYELEPGDHVLWKFAESE